MVTFRQDDMINIPPRIIRLCKLQADRQRIPLAVNGSVITEVNARYQKNKSYEIRPVLYTLTSEYRDKVQVNK